jgi:hypothetical protein
MRLSVSTLSNTGMGEGLPETAAACALLSARVRRLRRVPKVDAEIREREVDVTYQPLLETFRAFRAV